MTQKLKTPTLAGVGAEDFSAERLNTSDYSHIDRKVHSIVQAQRLSHRFGLPSIRADLIARLAYGGAHV